jgi:exopolyphosphatase/pppGpp-phosphohydrolase
MTLARQYSELYDSHDDIDETMLTAAAFCHDIGLCIDREKHEYIGANIIREDVVLESYFGEHKLTIIAEAIEDHRASLNGEIRSIYGKIISQADRGLYRSYHSMLQRAVDYRSHYPKGSVHKLATIIANHMHEKYGSPEARGNRIVFDVPIAQDCVAKTVKWFSNWIKVHDDAVILLRKAGLT